MNDIAAAAIGFAAGAAAAMGLGGGFILIIYLTWVGLSPQESQAANLIFFIPAALVSVIINRKNRLMDLSALPYAAAAGSIGAVIGLFAGDLIDADLLHRAFAILMISVGIRELFHRKPSEEHREKHRVAALERH